MATFLLLYIACLLSMDYIMQYFLILDALTPIFALILAGIITGIITFINTLRAKEQPKGHYIYNPNKKD